MKNIALASILWIGTLSTAGAIDLHNIIADFSFASGQLVEEEGRSEGICYKGKEPVAPSFEDSEGDRGVRFSGDSTVLISPEKFLFGEMEFGIGLRVWIDHYPPKSQSLVAQQGRFYVNLRADGRINAKVVTTGQTFELIGGKLQPGAWNDILIALQNDQLEIFIKGQSTAVAPTSGVLAGSRNPISLGAVLSKSGSLTDNPENEIRYGFEGIIQRLIFTKGEVHPSDFFRQN